jgi:ferredoxin
MLYIHPDECVDCGACEPVCPVDAIYFEDDIPGESNDYHRVNIEFGQVLTRSTALAFAARFARLAGCAVGRRHPIERAAPPRRRRFKVFR